MSVPSVSIAIPTYNKSSNLGLTLASLTLQTHKDFEVVILDDGSTDNTKATIEHYSGKLKVVYVHQANSGRSAARNSAIRKASGDLLILIDDDRMVVPGFVEGHVTSYQRGGDSRLTMGWQSGILARWFRNVELPASELVAILRRRPELLQKMGDDPVEFVTPEMIERDLPGVLKDFGTVDPYWAFLLGPQIQFFGLELKGLALPYAMAATANMSVNRRLALEVGLFDEGFRGWGFEDHEFQYRLHVAGAISQISREAENHHQLHPRGAILTKDWNRNGDYIIRKHPNLEVSLLAALLSNKISPMTANEILLSLKRDGGEHQSLAEQYRQTLHHELLWAFRQSV